MLFLNFDSDGRAKITTDAPSSAVFAWGAAYDADGALHVSYGTPAAGDPRIGGIARKATGEVYVTAATGASDVYHGGMRIATTGALCVAGGGTIANHSGALPFTSSGQLVVASAAIWAWQSSDLSLVPYIGSGTPSVTRAGNTATRITSAGLIETVNANLARYDYTVASSPDTSANARHAYTMGYNLPTVATSPLAGLTFDGFDNNFKSMGLNCGAAGVGVATADGSMEVEATIRRTRLGVDDFVVAVARRDGVSFNWALYVDNANKAAFGMRDSGGTFRSTTGTTSLSTSTTYTIKGKWTGTQIEIYVNDVLEGTPTALTALTAPDGTAMTIARSTWDTSDVTSPHPFKGTIANVKMYRGGVLQGRWPLTSLTRVPGLRNERAATNIALHNRDLTQAAWVKGATMTAAKDQTGVDGVANSASSLTGGAVQATNTCLQAVTLASSSRAFSFWAKRITGTGSVQVTTDNGSSYIEISTNGRLTSEWTRIDIPAQTVTNPVFGFYIDVNGDKIAIDFVQNETGKVTSNTTATGAAAVTRARDEISLATASLSGFSNTTLGVYARHMSDWGTVLTGDFNSPWALYTDSSNYILPYREVAAGHDFQTDIVNGGAAQAQILQGPDTGGVIAKSFVAVKANDFAAVVSGGTVQTDTSGTVPTVGTLYLTGYPGSELFPWGGWLFDLEVYAVRPSNTFMSNKVN